MDLIDRQDGDTISRQAAIDALMAWEEDSFWDEECLKHRGEPFWISPSDVIEQIPSAQSDSNAEFWENRAAEYSKIIASLVADMGKGINFESMQITETGKIVFGRAELVRKGKWVRTVLGSTSGYGTTVMYQCSECESMSISKYKFCPNCGAMMSEGEEDD